MSDPTIAAGADLDRWKRFLASFHIPFSEERLKRMGQPETITLTIGPADETGDARVVGYHGFCTVIEFKLDGSFFQIGAWE